MLRAFVFWKIEVILQNLHGTTIRFIVKNSVKMHHYTFPTPTFAAYHKNLIPNVLPSLLPESLLFLQAT
jgi:hypothetical protein